MSDTVKRKQEVVAHHALAARLLVELSTALTLLDADHRTQKDAHSRGYSYPPSKRVTTMVDAIGQAVKEALA